MWELYARSDVFAELETRPLEERKAVRDSLARLLEDPYDPPGLSCYMLKMADNHDLYVADLPGGWHVTYTPRVGLPPVFMDRRLVVIRSLDHLPAW